MACVCLVYDCLYPWTMGGGERWYRALAEGLAAAGHEVTYLTLRQWRRGEAPRIDGVRVVAVGPRLGLYGGGRRRVLPPLVFGVGVLGHLLRHGAAYDVVQTGAFPYFPLLAIGALRRRSGYALVVDWFEVWTRRYWRSYLGPWRGWLGWGVQRLCLRVTPHACCFSDVQRRRLREAGYRGEVTRLTGAYDGPAAASVPLPAEPVVVYVGRHIPEKRVPALVAAVAEARRAAPELRAILFGDGPDRAAVEAAVAGAGLDGAIERPGFVDDETLDGVLRRALCLVLPSRREGYGLVVIEAAARGVPSVVVRGPDNAATELIEAGVNGFVAPSASAADLGDAILRVRAAGPALRTSTAGWFARNVDRLSSRGSIATVERIYAAELASAPASQAAAKAARGRTTDG